MPVCVEHPELICQLAQGSYSRIYIAVSSSSGEEIAVKRYLSGDRGDREYKRETSILRHLEGLSQSSPYVISPRLDAVPYPLIGLELCARGDLTDYVHNVAPCVRETRRIARELALGLVFLHDHGIAHEDVKPDNIGMTADFHVRILDFGLAVRTRPTELFESFEAHAQLSSRYGTVPYTSPEKLQGKLHGLEVDWWSFGVILYELIFRCLPWDAESLDDMAELICTQPLKMPQQAAEPSLASSVGLIRNLIEDKDPKQRLGYHFGGREVLAHPFLTKRGHRRDDAESGRDAASESKQAHK
ncbi:Protein kinase, putative [Hondaea fermentalgiana]|uniref:non-specific serine/threonine protein kinase n=1 Tax=Hondaea fermentalgiana TaxID=2315210 RepID=A0A2R5G492_9STRA|nr:Protein kinase, putative [Hondaea fermentalgiana]|eukprot:GBG25129.1 Protein kinase, putative [Hondaea fermentalgiana]